MNFYYNAAHKAATDLIMDNKTVNFDTAVTLTFKHSILSDNTRARIIETYLNVINKKVYGSACWQRVFNYDCDKGIRMAVIMESRFGNEPHLHFAMKKPYFMSRDEFYGLLEDCWVNLDKNWRMNITSDKFNDVRPIWNEHGWIRYITKQIDDKNTDGLLIEYCNL